MEKKINVSVILLLTLLFKYWGGFVFVFFLMRSLSPRFLHRREQLYFFTMLGNLPCCSYSNTLAPVPSAPRQWLVQWSNNSSCQPGQYFCSVRWLFPLCISCHCFLTLQSFRRPRVVTGFHSLGRMITTKHKSPSCLPLAHLFCADPTAWALPAMLKMLHTTVAVYIYIYILKLAHFPGLALVMDPTHVKMKNAIIQHQPLLWKIGTGQKFWVPEAGEQW